MVLRLPHTHDCAQEGRDFSLEIEPVRVCKELQESGAVPMDALENLKETADGGKELLVDRAAAIPEVAALVAKRAEDARRVVSYFVETLTQQSVVDRMPFGMRLIAKTILHLSRARFGGATEDQL